MKKLNFAVLLAMLLCLFSTCELFYNSKAINGTVILTLNEIPLENSNFYISNYDRGVPPPPIQITAYTIDMDWIASAPVNLRANNDEYNKGTHQWTLNIPANKLPGYFYLWVTYWRYDVAFGLAGILTEKYWIEDENTIVNIGTINYNVVQLSGNMPITINNNQFFGWRGMRLTLLPTGNVSFFPTYLTIIDQNGDWSFNLDQRYLETYIEFALDIRENHNNHDILRKTLNPYVLTVSDTGIDVTFPNYPDGVNFER